MTYGHFIIKTPCPPVTGVDIVIGRKCEVDVNGRPGTLPAGGHVNDRWRTTPDFLLSQTIAAIAFACGIVSFQFRDRRPMLLWLF